MEDKTEIKELVDRLNLSPHPEGGYYREVYRSKEDIKRSGGELRNAGTGIYFLLPAEIYTSWHRVTSDELWHFYEGDRLILEVIDSDGEFKQLPLCEKLPAGCDYQRLVPQNCWQRAYSTGAYSLAGCTVTPGFEFEDFEMVEQEQLANWYPEIAEKITNDPFSNC